MPTRGVGGDSIEEIHCGFADYLVGVEQPHAHVEQSGLVLRGDV
jgi:hypothetical protein